MSKATDQAAVFDLFGVRMTWNVPARLYVDGDILCCGIRDTLHLFTKTHLCL